MQKKGGYKVIIDTNVLISSLMGKEVSKLNQILGEGKITIIFSRESWDEFFTVVKRPKLKKYFNRDKVAILIALLSHISEFVKVNSYVTSCRDEKDNFLLELAKDSKADYLISGDHDLLILKKFGNTHIVNFNQFMKLMSL